MTDISYQYYIDSDLQKRKKKELHEVIVTNAQNCRGF